MISSNHGPTPKIETILSQNGFDGTLINARTYCSSQKTAYRRIGEGYYPMIQWGMGNHSFDSATQALLIDVGVVIRYIDNLIDIYGVAPRDIIQELHSPKHLPCIGELLESISAPGNPGMFCEAAENILAIAQQLNHADDRSYARLRTLEGAATGVLFYSAICQLVVPSRRHRLFRAMSSFAGAANLIDSLADVREDTRATPKCVMILTAMLFLNLTRLVWYCPARFSTASVSVAFFSDYYLSRKARAKWSDVTRIEAWCRTIEWERSSIGAEEGSDS